MTEPRNLFSLIFFFLYLFCASSFLLTKPLDKKNDEVCISQEELNLYNSIIEYRHKHKLPAIPLSKSLTFVAQQHVLDLSENHPAKGNCNMHSWSDKGKWKGCCYTADNANASCMWTKPAELTNYKSNGFEIACTGAFGTEAILKCWKESPGHNGVILNHSPWKKMKWNAIGIGIYKEYAVVWFGEAEDKEVKPSLCKAIPK
jgi:uncharacterized protein YkwD